jgi:hypothetical protein
MASGVRQMSRNICPSAVWIRACEARMPARPGSARPDPAAVRSRPRVPCGPQFRQHRRRPRGPGAARSACSRTSCWASSRFTPGGVVGLLRVGDPRRPRSGSAAGPRRPARLAPADRDRRGPPRIGPEAQCRARGCHHAVSRVLPPVMLVACRAARQGESGKCERPHRPASGIRLQCMLEWQQAAAGAAMRGSRR